MKVLNVANIVLWGVILMALVYFGVKGSHDYGYVNGYWNGYDKGYVNKLCGRAQCTAEIVKWTQTNKSYGGQKR